MSRRRFRGQGGADPVSLIVDWSSTRTLATSLPARRHGDCDADAGLRSDEELKNARFKKRLADGFKQDGSYTE